MTDPRGIEPVGEVKFKGHPRDGKDLSAVGVVRDLLIVAGDEDDRLQVLQRRNDHYEVLPGREVPLNDAGQEADIEGIACEGDTIYVVGSHSCKRPKPKASASREENLGRLEIVEPPSPFRSLLVRFRVSAEGEHAALEATTLRAVIAGTKVLEPFTHIPCKENGVDIEGLAVRGGLLHVGFRGPVFQHGFVPVLTCSFASPVTAAEALYLNLGGRGIRDLERVDGGFLVLAGPVSDVPASFQLYFWDGADCLPGLRDRGEGRLLLLGEVPTPEGAKAEGLAVERESDGHYTVLVLFDGLKEGGAARFRVRKPDHVPGR
jgi:hypothetical protein